MNKPPQPFDRNKYLSDKDKRAKEQRGASAHTNPKTHARRDEAPRARKAPPPPRAPRNLPVPSSDGKRELVQRLRNATSTIDRISNWLVPSYDTQGPTPESMARPMLVRGMWLTVIIFGSILAWAAIMPLATGAVAPGRLVVDSNRKDIQHLEGGIVQDILVKEGSRVKAGEVLVRLDPTTASARQGLIYSQWMAAKATEARLIAERDNADAVTFPASLLENSLKDKETEAAIDAQERLFVSRRDAVNGQINVLDQKIAQSGEEIRGLREQISSSSSQISLLDEEIQTVSQLLASGNAQRPRLLALERQKAAIVGQRGQAQAMISRVNQTINEAKIEKINLKNDFLNKVVAELKETQVQIATLEEQQRASDDVARRIEITSPIDGQVTGLRVFTKGGVIKPGDTIMSIVPIGDELTVEARVSPYDIEVVHEGLEAQVRFSGLSTRRFHPVKGTVITVSADRFDDQNTGEAFYVARIRIPKEEMEYFDGVALSPGMPVETLIVTGSRTMLSYLFRPINDSFSRAFRQD